MGTCLAVFSTMKGLLAIVCALCLQGSLARDYYRCSWITSPTIDCSTFTDQPTCGTNLVTYKNKCEFSKAHCADKTIDLKHLNACTDADKPTVDPVAGAEVVFDFLCSSLSHTTCPLEESKVCATDGRTYSNHCEYEKAKCTHRDLEVVSYSECTA